MWIKIGRFFKESLNWFKIWTSLCKSDATLKSKQFHWKMLHRVIHTEKKLALFGLSSGLCKMCNVHQESLVHLLWDCTFAKQSWCKIIPKIELYLLNELDIELVNPMQTALLSMYTFPSKTKLVNTLIVETKWMIWKNRNDMKYNNKISNCNVLLNCNMNNVNDHLHWNKDHCMIDMFRQYCL